MNLKLILGLMLGGLLAGCSKQETTSPPAPTQPVAASPAAAPAAAEKTAPVIPAATTSAITDAVASATTTAAAATNAAPIPSNSASAVVQSALGKLDEVTKSPLQNPAGVPANDSTPPALGASPGSLADLSTDQVTQGLKAALGKGLEHAIASLGQPGGFFKNAKVKIPLPDKLRTVEKTLRTLGQGQLADDSIATMNQAAEQAVPAAAEVFANSLKNMSLEDAKGILNGPPDAATQFFRRTTDKELTQKFLPIVRPAMAKCGATAAYQQVLDKAGAAVPFFSNPSLDLNAYVTSKAMDGLFTMVAEEEKKIRENPVARTTDLLKSVFGSLQK
jgi:hypothetical protein